MSELSIIVPCRNDAAVLTGTLEALHDVVSHHSLSVETLIVDDDSEDATIKTAVDAAHRFSALHIRVLARKRLQPGLGGVLRYGMAFALGRYCVLVSPDGCDPVELIPAFLFKLRGGKQLVQCSPHLRGEDAEADRKLLRPFQATYRKLAQSLLGAKVLETTYAFRAFDRVFVQALGLSAKHYNVCPEMTFKVMLCGGEVEYVAGRPKDTRPDGKRRIKPPVEFGGYFYVLLRAALHRAALRRWF